MATQLRFDKVTVLSWGMRRIPHLKSFLPEVGSISYAPHAIIARPCDAVAGWGKKAHSIPAHKMSAKRNIPYIAVEDGFLRSFGLGVDKAPPISLVVDYTGIYYESTRPSDLETMLEIGHFDAALISRAEKAMEWLKHAQLTKYNQGLIDYTGPHIRRLIIDQTTGDASVLLSGAKENTFEKMVIDAMDAQDPSGIAIKLHPDTMKGKRGGYLKGLAEKYGVRLIDTPVNPWTLLAHTDKVSTISSQFGFDALMAGKKVDCYGLPFYAGWGLTEDHVTCLRRTQKRSVSEIFAAAYILYARYIDPFTGAPSTLEDSIGLMSDLVRYEKRVKTISEAVGFSQWKRYFIPRFVGKKLSFSTRAAKELPLIWASRQDHLIAENAISVEQNVIRMEDGFVRSRGLGAHLALPWSLVIDDLGIYYDPRTVSRLEYILQNDEMPAGLLTRAANVRDLLLKNSISKYNTGTATAPAITSQSKTVILVPGQVEDDASIRTGTESIRTNLDLLKAVRERNPNAYLLYKPHPDIEAGRRKGKIASELMEKYSDQIVGGYSITSLWPVVNEVHTMTSLSGFEALLRGKSVTVYGHPFYAGWGLTTDYYPFERRTRKLTLDQLVAGALILYPTYYDWKTEKLCTVETVIGRLASLPEKKDR